MASTAKRWTALSDEELGWLLSLLKGADSVELKLTVPEGDYRIQGKGGDSVVKLRPVVPHELPASLRKSPNLVVEVDAMPGGSYVCSAALKAPGGIDDAREVAHGIRPIRRLFSKQQRPSSPSTPPKASAWTTCRCWGRSPCSS